MKSETKEKRLSLLLSSQWLRTTSELVHSFLQLKFPRQVEAARLPLTQEHPSRTPGERSASFVGSSAIISPTHKHPLQVLENMGTTERLRPGLSDPNSLSNTLLPVYFTGALTELGCGEIVGLPGKQEDICKRVCEEHPGPPGFTPCKPRDRATAGAQ